MSRIRAVTLDAAGTLIQVRESVGETYSRLAADHGIGIDPRDVSRAFRTVFPRMSPLAFGNSDPQRLLRQERDWWRTLVRNCLGAQGQHPAFGAFFDALYGYYADPAAWQLYDEVAGVLDALDDAGIPVLVLSNFDSRLHRILDGLGVHHRFKQVLCSSEVGAAKPQAQIFRVACDVLGRIPGDVLHVGDDRRADLEGARGAGLGALWVRRGEEPDPGAGTVRDLGPVPMLVAGDA